MLTGDALHIFILQERIVHKQKIACQIVMVKNDLQNLVHEAPNFSKIDEVLTPVSTK